MTTENKQHRAQMILYAGTGSQLGRRSAVGLLWTSKATPIAFRDGDDCEGFRVLWEATGEMQEVAEALGLDVMDEPGLWLFTATFVESEYLRSIEADSWEYLAESLECERLHLTPCLGGEGFQIIRGALEGLDGWVPA